MNKTMTKAVAVAGALTLLLSGCSSNADSTGEAQLTVDITDDACTVSAAEAPSGTITFTLNNNGAEKNEFEILSEDGLRIVSEKENLAPGQTGVTFAVALQPGAYYTACKTGMVGPLVGKTEFTVTDSGAKVEVSEAETQAAEQYAEYVRAEVAALMSETETFAAAYKAGDTAKAKELYAPTRMHYERIEPIAESLGDLDPALDLREPDLDENGQWDTMSGEKADWSGWHAIEKDLWRPADFSGWDTAKRDALADKLVADTKELSDYVNNKAEDKFLISLHDISNGAITLMDEVANSKVTGEEEFFSHTDFYDFAANVEGAKKAYEIVKPILAEKPDGAAMIEELDASFAQVEEDLAAYKQGDGYVEYTLSKEEADKLMTNVIVLTKNLSDLTQTLLGEVRPAEEE